ncbi:MAG: RNA pseudouridine synthase [Planctomycetia bacterium]|nr:RNA pseudouridine synthase [Planctomycetia bacterium]
MHVLYEDNHLLVVNKPAGLPTMGVAEGEKSLLTVAKHYIGEKYHKPGNVYLGIVSRLDTPTTGVVIIARTSKAADRLNRQFREHTVRKIYWAVVEGTPPPNGTLSDRMGEEKRHRKMYVTQNADGIPAVLHYKTIRNFGKESLLEIQLETGRKHQIRVQLAHQGWPIVGDRKYGAQTTFPVGIALHARELTFVHPTLNDERTLFAELPATWKKWNLEE